MFVIKLKGYLLQVSTERVLDCNTYEHRGNPGFVHFIPGTSVNVKCWESSWQMLSTCGGRFRIKDLGGGVSKAVTLRRIEVEKVG